MATFRQTTSPEGGPMRTLRNHARNAILVSSFLAATLSACSPPPSSGHDGDVGTIGLALQVAPGVTINTISWSIANATTAFTQSGTVNVQNSNTIRFQVGGLPAGAGYTITLNATSADGAFTCAGMAGFAVTAGMTSTVSVMLTCVANGNGS